MDGQQQAPIERKGRKILKPVTFPTLEKRLEAIKYCKAKKTNFSALMRKLLARQMREDPLEPPAGPSIRLKDPGR
jgi:hypothetical protein